MRPLSLLAAAMLTLLLASCASPIAMRIERNPEIYSKLNERHKTMVQRGEIEEGMSKQAVFIAWGQPDRAFKGSRGGKAMEQWTYLAYDPVPGTMAGPGYGAWGIGAPYRYYYDPFYYYQPMVSYVPYERAKVEFTNARVTAWKR